MLWPSSSIESKVCEWLRNHIRNTCLNTHLITMHTPIRMTPPWPSRGSGCSSPAPRALACPVAQWRQFAFWNMDMSVKMDMWLGRGWCAVWMYSWLCCDRLGWWRLVMSLCIRIGKRIGPGFGCGESSDKARCSRVAIRIGGQCVLSSVTPRMTTQPLDNASSYGQI